MEQLTGTLGQAIETLKKNLSGGVTAAENMAAGRLIEAASNTASSSTWLPARPP
jgi:hypothetical protein